MAEATESSPEALGQALDGWWVSTNISFLARYWHTANEALERVSSDPSSFAEFRNNSHEDHYVKAVLGNHQEHHNYSGLLLTYANFDEFMTVLSQRLGEALDAPIGPNELKDWGVKRFQKFIHKVCRIDPAEAKIDWVLLEDMATVRNAIIHANGNASLVSNRSQLERIVERRSPKLSFKHGSRLVVSKDFVAECMMAVRNTALAVNALARPKATDNPETQTGSS